MVLLTMSGCRTEAEVFMPVDAPRCVLCRPFLHSEHMLPVDFSFWHFVQVFPQSLGSDEHEVSTLLITQASYPELWRWSSVPYCEEGQRITLSGRMTSSGFLLSPFTVD
jgi:hypothetical protein